MNNENRWLIRRAFDQIRGSGEQGGKVLPYLLIAIMLSPTVPIELVCRIGKGLINIISYNQKKAGK